MTTASGGMDPWDHKCAGFYLTGGWWRGKPEDEMPSILWIRKRRLINDSHVLNMQAVWHACFNSSAIILYSLSWTPSAQLESIRCTQEINTYYDCTHWACEQHRTERIVELQTLNPILIIDFCKITILSLSKDFVPEPHPPWMIFHVVARDRLGSYHVSSFQYPCP